jgi:polar amino acid transport system substrate-binding protein
VEGLRAGEVAAAVVDGAAVTALIEGADDSIVPMEESLAPEEYVLVFPAGSNLLEAFNAAIAEMEADGFIAGREMYWFYEQEMAAGR